MTAVAPRIVNDVSYATGINHGSDFSWQAQSLVMLEGDTCCSPYCITDVSFATRIVAGGVFGEVGQ